MRHSISVKIFVSAAILFLLLLAVQMFVINGRFDDLYIGSMLQSYQTELETYSQKIGDDPGAADQQCKLYSAHTQSPLLSVSSDGDILGEEFMSRLGLLTMRLSDGSTAAIPLAYLEDQEVVPRLHTGFRARVLAVRLGDTEYYEPLSLTVDQTSYTNSESMSAYRLNNPDVEVTELQGTIMHIQRLLDDGNSVHRNAVMIYEALKDTIIRGGDIGAFLNQSSKSDLIDDDSMHYRLIYSSHETGGETYYYAGIQRFVFTGREHGYIQSYLNRIYVVLGILLVVAAYFLSRYLSRPLVHLNQVTERLSNLDFSQKASISSNDELGSLAEHINIMSANLEKSIAEINAASQRSKDNEERMKRLLADLAHEFKTPLSIISSYTEIFEKGLEIDDPKKYFAIIDRQISRLSDMVNEVIELSHIQNGTWETDIQVWEISEIIDPVVDGFSGRINRSGIDFSYRPMDAAVMADAKRISQVLTNLMSNAIKYTTGDRRVTLEVGRCAEDPALIEIRLSNSGRLSEEDQKKIWQRYYHSAESVEKALLPSEGIGLDIVREILESHNSRYGVSQEGDCICFYFTLQQADEDPALEL